MSGLEGGKQMFMEFSVKEGKGAAQMKKTPSCSLGVQGLP